MRAKNMLTKFLAGVACVGLIVGATLGVQKLIDEKTTQEDTDQNVEQTASIELASIDDLGIEI